MKKTGMLLLALFMVGLVVSCGNSRGDGGTTRTTLSAIRWVPVRESATPTPEWVNGPGWTEGTFNGQKVYLITVEAEAATKEKAKIACELARVETLARAIKELSTTMLASATAGMLNDSEDLETYFEKTTAAVSKNVDTSGAIAAASYWAYGQYIDDDAGTKRDVWRYVIQYAISKAKVDAAMAGAWGDTRNNYPPELVNRVENTLGSLMDASDARENQ